MCDVSCARTNAFCAGGLCLSHVGTTIVGEINPITAGPQLGAKYTDDWCRFPFVQVRLRRSHVAWLTTSAVAKMAENAIHAYQRKASYRCQASATGLPRSD